MFRVPGGNRGAEAAPTLLLDRSELALLLNEFRDQTGPTGLMRRAETGASVSVKILMEQITMSILRAERIAHRAFEWPLAIVSSPPKLDQTIGKFVRDFFQGQEISRMSWTLHFKIVAVVVMKLLE